MAGTGVAYPVSSTELSLGLEAVRGTAAATPLWLPVQQPKLKFDQAVIDDDSLQGSMVEVYDQELGLRYDSHGWDGYPYLDTFPLLLAAQLGSSDTKTVAPTSTTLAASALKGATTISTSASVAADSWVTIGSGGTLETHLTTAVSGTAAPYTVTLAAPLIYAQANSAAVTGLTKHQWSLLNNSPSSGNMPLSCTITDFDGEQWRQFTAAQLDKLTIKGNATGFVNYSTTWFANPFTNPSAPTSSFSDVTAPQGWTATFSIGGTQITYVEDWEIDLGRQVKAVPAITGANTYFEYMVNGITAMGKLTFIEQSGAPQISQYLAGTKESLDITLYDTNTGFALNLHSTTAAFKTGELVRGKKDEVKAQLDIQLLPSATDATAGGKSPLIATVANATATAYVGS